MPVVIQSNDIRTRLKQPAVIPRVALLYNPGLDNSWFIVTGLIGALLVLQGSIVAAAMDSETRQAIYNADQEVDGQSDLYLGDLCVLCDGFEGGESGRWD